MTASNLPPMTGVKSSNVESIGHDPERQSLFVRFKSGGLYKYDGVSPEAHAAFMKSDSKGKHFKQNIMGKYVHQKVQG